MRDYEEYRAILALWEEGENKKAISRILNIPRGTVTDCIKRYGNLQGLEENLARASRSTPDAVLERIRNPEEIEVQKAYAYVLGIYLGDGYIVLNQRVYFLRISLDVKYPNIIQTCVANIQQLLPNNKVNVLKRTQANCVEVVCTYKFWPDLFPQHGKGEKHHRKIALESWQQTIVDAYPLEFLRGLYHSDGSRFSNVVNGTDYPRYQFTNHSLDILKLFTDTCDRLGLHWSVKHRPNYNNQATDVFVSKRPDVAFLDEHVGPKT
ncbi:MAG: helix-turn-helix domain-containing protein [Anaerolineae bacterium]|nr:helix-turn-helix domain-containing protein [Anaerolineae bacterium]